MYLRFKALPLLAALSSLADFCSLSLSIFAAEIPRRAVWKNEEDFPAKVKKRLRFAICVIYAIWFVETLQLQTGEDRGEETAQQTGQTAYSQQAAFSAYIIPK